MIKTMLGMAIVLSMSTTSVAQVEPRLYEQEPYDQLTLDRANDNAVLKVLPLNFPDRKIPEKPGLHEVLRVRVVDQPGREYRVSWRHIEKLELFEQMVLAEAEKLAAGGKFDEAFDYYTFLLQEYPQMPELQPSLQRYLMNEAAQLYRQTRFEEALIRLHEIHLKNPTRDGLSRALTGVIGKLVQSHVDAGRYREARHLLNRTKTRYKDAQSALLDKWQAQLAAAAQKQLVKTRAHLNANQLREAYLSSRQMLTIWPALEGAIDMAAEVAERYPLVTVGVTQPAIELDPARIDNWSARRSGRLLYRALTEFAGRGPEGGRYVCPLGTLQSSEDRRQLQLSLRESLQTGGAGGLTGFDLSRHLLDMATESHTTFSPMWAEFLQAVRVDDIHQVDIELLRPHLRPEALLQTTIFARAEAGPSEMGLQPYVVAARDGDVTRYLGADRYLLRGATQPTEIVERYFADSQTAVGALREGEIDVLDRVHPADVRRLSQDGWLVVEPYTSPSVQLLIPNFQRPLTANRVFRRALVYGINRNAILQRDVFSGKPLAGCRVISGPFAAGVTRDDPLGYAYDARIQPRPYEPRLALTLSQIARTEVAETARKAGRPPPPEKSELVLVHPVGDLARFACEAIAKDLQRVGIACRLRPLAAGVTRPASDDWDLWYVDVVMQEPLVDARRMLGSDGLIHSTSSYLTLALRRLDEARNWQQARDRLHEIHRLTYDEVTVIPLWQLVDHLAYNRSVRGIGQEPVTLYQDIEQWQISPRVSDE